MAIIRWFIQILPLWMFLQATKTTAPLPCIFSWSGKHLLNCGAVEVCDGVYIVRVSKIEWKRKYDKLMTEAENIRLTHLTLDEEVQGDGK
jgi:hypothetical protein